jgi:hypothetical protein
MFPSAWPFSAFTSRRDRAALLAGLGIELIQSIDPFLDNLLGLLVSNPVP